MVNSQKSNSSVHGAHEGDVEDELPLPTYDPSVAPAIVLGLEATRDYVLNLVGRRSDKVEESLGKKIADLTEAVHRLRPRSPPSDGSAAPRRHRQLSGQRVGEQVRNNGEHQDHQSEGAGSYYEPVRRAYNHHGGGLHHGGGHERPRRAYEDDGIGRIKISIPSFSGKDNPDDYLEWEMRVDQIFDGQRYTEEKKVRAASIEFTGYALIWWNQLCRAGGRPESWNQMKSIMKRRFVSEHFTRTLYTRLQQLRQGNSSVEEYYKEMEILSTRTGVEEQEEATMARFMHGLKSEVRDRVDMVEYNGLQGLLHHAIRAEQQVKRRGGHDNLSNSMRCNYQREGGGNNDFQIRF